MQDILSADVTILKKRWQALFDNVEEGICIVDKNFRIIDFNPACEIMTGFLKEEVIGKVYSDIFKCHDAKGNYLNNTLVKKAFMTGEIVPYDEHLHSNKDQVETWIASSLVPYLNPKNENECLGVIRDINSYKQVDKLKSDFVSIASHELRTPLTIVNGYLSLLSNDDLENLDQEEKEKQERIIIAKVYQETKRLNSLVEDLLDISRIEQGQLKVTFKPTDLNDLILTTVDEYQPLAKGKNLYLKYESLGKPLEVVCDPCRIKQVLTNLIDNSVKYTTSGGLVITARTAGDTLTVAVKDTGVGISSKLTDHLFEKFQQRPDSYLKENKGTGLGLFIVKGIVELHRGKVWVESKERVGTTFYFSLPLNIK